MRYRRFGGLGWQVSEIGYGMWGLSDWTGSDDAHTHSALNEAVRLGCNFFDTAWVYGDGHGEGMLGKLFRAHPDQRLYCTSKIPPKNLTWPSRRGMRLDEVFPADHIREYAARSLENTRLPRLDLLQFHVWEDAWARDERWARAIDDLKQQGLIAAAGVSVNRWEPANVLQTLRTGLIDAVQVIYNIFDQSPEDELFAVCQELDIAVIARVPFDEGSLTGTLTLDSKWPSGDFRNIYFGKANLAPTVKRVEALRPVVPEGMTMAELALRFAISDPRVSTVIPGMRSIAHVASNIAVSDGKPLAEELLGRLRAHRWDRSPTQWSH